MAYTISDAQLRLANRLGENSVPSVVSESTKRRNWFTEGAQVIFTKKPYWFTQHIDTQATVANRPDYSFPSDFRREIMIYVDGQKYEKIEPPQIDDIRSNLHPVQVLYDTYKYAYYTFDEKFYLIPTPSAAPTSYAITSITRSGTTATVTTTASHGLSTNDYVVISGAGESEYNVEAQIIYLSATTFSYTVSGTPTTPATGTIVYAKNNIEVWYYQDFTAYSADTDALQIPDKYINALVAYAEGRYWSSAHKRGKASDAFTEFESIISDIEAEHTRRNFYTGLI